MIKTELGDLFAFAVNSRSGLDSKAVGAFCKGLSHWAMRGEKENELWEQRPGSKHNFVDWRKIELKNDIFVFRPKIGTMKVTIDIADKIPRIFKAKSLAREIFKRFMHINGGALVRTNEIRIHALEMMKVLCTFPYDWVSIISLGNLQARWAFHCAESVFFSYIFGGIILNKKNALTYMQKPDSIFVDSDLEYIGKGGV